MRYRQCIYVQFADVDNCTMDMEENNLIFWKYVLNYLGERHLSENRVTIRERTGANDEAKRQSPGEEETGGLRYILGTWL